MVTCPQIPSFTSGLFHLLHLFVLTSTYASIVIAQLSDYAQQSFSSDEGPSLHLAISALESLHSAWHSRSVKPAWADFEVALDAGVSKIAEYYEKTAESDAHIFAMGNDTNCLHFQSLGSSLPHSTRPFTEDEPFQETLGPSPTK
jgi:hypothetical protein